MKETPRQYQADQRVGRIVLNYLLIMRHFPKDQERFPLTGSYVQRIARKLGCPVGEHRALRIIRVLEHSEAIERCGSYRQGYHYRAGAGSFRVTLWRLRLATMKVSVRRQRRRKPWWKHPLFGYGVKSYPRSLPTALRHWQEAPQGSE